MLLIDNVFYLYLDFKFYKACYIILFHQESLPDHGNVCALSIVIVLYKIDQLLACWFYLYYLVMFLYDYTLCFTGSPCYNVSYNNYISLWLCSYSLVNIEFCYQQT